MNHRLLALLPTLALSLHGTTTAMATEETPYEVIRQYSGFELRRYAPYLVAETRVTGKFEDVGNQAFRCCSVTSPATIAATKASR